jgi:putative FmdB family regulatory protein
MPIYEYRCRACDNVFEEWQKDFKEREPACPICGEPAERLISHTSFILKGGGWYVTDYCGKNPSASSGEGAAAPAPAPSAKTGGCAASCASSQ